MWDFGYWGFCDCEGAEFCVCGQVRWGGIFVQCEGQVGGFCGVGVLGIVGNVDDFYAFEEGGGQYVGGQIVFWGGCNDEGSKLCVLQVVNCVEGEAQFDGEGGEGVMWMEGDCLEEG